ncbi:MAG: HlyD family efflux transporter periplasmic adaptor subunit, partial [Roseburia sp.]
GETASLQGVYNINKGYAVFKQINILYQNKEYTIVETGTNYGLSLYDHIALDGTKINENDLIH